MAVSAYHSITFLSIHIVLALVITVAQYNSSVILIYTVIYNSLSCNRKNLLFQKIRDHKYSKHFTNYPQSEGTAPQSAGIS